VRGKDTPKIATALVSGQTCRQNCTAKITDCQFVGSTPTLLLTTALSGGQI